jgi:predicted alpha/beta hydrolase family esterase
MIGRRFLIIHGVENRRPPGHWQYQLAETLRADGEVVLYPQLPDTDEPRLDRWLELLAAELAQLGTSERIVLCHSLGCLLWLHHAVRATAAQQVDRVLLVSPPSPTVLWPAVSSFAPPANFDPAPLAATSKSRIRIVCSDNDPFCPESATAAYARPLDLDVDLIPGGGHLSEADGYGRWPSVAAWCRDGDVRVVAQHNTV